MRHILLAAVAVAGFGDVTWGQLWGGSTARPANASLASASTGSLQPAPATPLGSSTAGATTGSGHYLGVQINEVPAAGLVVGAVATGGPSALAGLRAGDVVKSANDQPVRTNAELSRIVAGLPAGTRLKLNVSRLGIEQIIEIVPTERSAPATLTIGAKRNRGLGVTLGHVTPAVATRLGVPDTRGAVVTGYYTGSPAHRAGIPNHAVIVAFDGKPISSPEELRAAIGAIEPARAVAVKYYDRGQLLERTVTLDPVTTTATSTTSYSAPSTGTATLQPTLAPLEPRVTSNVSTIGGMSTAADHHTQELRRLEQRVVELERKLREVETQMGTARR